MARRARTNHETYSNGGYSYSNAPSSSNSNSGSHYYSPSGGTSGFYMYTQNGASAPTHLLTRTTNRSSLIMPFREWQVDNRVAGTPTTRTLQERARISESCARVSVTPWVLPEGRLRSRPPG